MIRRIPGLSWSRPALVPDRLRGETRVGPRCVCDRVGRPDRDWEVRAGPLVWDAFAEKAGLALARSTGSLAPKVQWLAEDSMEMLGNRADQALPSEEARLQGGDSPN